MVAQIKIISYIFLLRVKIQSRKSL